MPFALMSRCVHGPSCRTTDGDGGPGSAGLDSASLFDGNLWFFTKASSHKVQEVSEDQRVGVTYADPSKQNYVSLSGRARIVRDRGTIDAHWQESLKTWFPKGKDDPEIAIMKVEVEAAEYWDSPNSTMVHAYGYLKAVLTGSSPSSGENEKLNFA